ncbi:hypothetical protein EV361DRAFT_796896 [Lentinula raphanica]|nr:hypothetical protein F5880DRAFT_1473864 [Lentinula raphanica]KAJ3973106.1 hypothetical protein EV361DRAFT_796896 [Lentinula raphanica]
MPVPLRATANLRAEAKYNVVTDFPNYDLHSAAASGNQGLAEYALNRGQPVNSVVDGVLPLHAACAGGHEQVVKLLLDHGADVNAARLPRRYSNEKNRDASAPILGTTGSTPLHFAAANGNKNIINILLLRGAHADRGDKHGITPAMLAEQHGWLECAEVLNNWVKNKDRDLRERVQPDGAVSMAPSVAHPSSGHEDDNKPNTKKHIQVKRSIDTALNMFKAGSMSTPPSKLASSSTNNVRNTSPVSPTRSRRDFSPSPSEDGRFSPSPSPINPESRRPSLPHIYQTPSNSSQRPQKPTTLTKSRHSRRPRSAGTDAEQDPDVDGSNTGFGRGSTSKKLGTKYSLLNLFKKGTESGGVPLERTSSHQSSTSILGMYSPSQKSTKTTPSLSASPQQNSLSLNDNGPLPTSGYRFGAPSHMRTSPSTSSSFHQQSYTPPPLTEENEYGHPIQPSIAARIQTRHRGSSFASSDSSLSPALSGDEPTAESTLHTDFPFSLDAPPPIDEVDVVAPIQLQLSPPPVDSRTRGDSVSSTSTADSGLNPSLSASASTSGSGGSGAIPTPMISPDGGSYLSLPSPDSRPRPNRDKVNIPEVSYNDYHEGLEDTPVQDFAVIGINARRGNSALENINIISSHAEAEALVQRTQQDILSAHADGQSSSGDSMPLSARLAALGESLELERRLREQKQAEELRAQISATESFEDGTSSTARTEILRQCSLDQLSKSASPSRIRRFATGEAARIGVLNGGCKCYQADHIFC